MRPATTRSSSASPPGGGAGPTTSGARRCSWPRRRPTMSTATSSRSTAAGLPAETVVFGEILLRLSAPGSELLLQSGRLEVHVGGAEANVAVALAGLGHAVRMASVVPDNPLGRAALTFLRGQGVDCSAVSKRDARMGLY